MAVIGGSAGYATIDPTQANPIGDAIQGVENSAFKYRAEQSEKRAAAAKEQRQLQEDSRKEFEDKEKFDKDNPFLSASYSEDGVRKNYANTAKQTYLNAKKQYALTRDPKWMGIADNAISNLKVIKEIPEEINKKIEDFTKNADKYDSEDLVAKAKILDDFTKSMIVRQDESGNVKFSQAELNEDGTINKLKFKDLNVGEVMGMFKPDEKLDWAKQAVEFNKIVGKETTDKYLKGNIEYTRKHTPGAETAAETKAKTIVSNPAYVRQIKRQLGIDANDDSKNKEVFDYAKKQFTDLAPDTTTESDDYKKRAYDLSVSKEAFDRKQAGIVNARENSKAKGNATQSSQTTTYDAGSKIGAFKFGKGTELTNYTYSGTDNNPKTFSIHKTPDGKAYMTVYNTVFDEDTQTTKKVTKTYDVNSSRADDKTLVNEVATLAGFGNLDGLKEVIDRSGKQTTKTTQAPVNKNVVKSKKIQFDSKGNIID